MARHTMTPARRAALKRAQAASARKRRGKGKGKLAAANRQLGKRRSRKAILKRSLVAGGIAAGLMVATQAGAVHYANVQHNKKNKRHMQHAAAQRHQHELRQHYRRNLGRHRAKTHGLPVGKTHAGRNWRNRHQHVVING